MSGYPEGLWPQDYCYMEGHEFRGGACVRCGERLRCSVCGQYMIVEDAEMRHEHPPPHGWECECEICVGVPVEGEGNGLLP